MTGKPVAADLPPIVPVVPQVALPKTPTPARVKNALTATKSLLRKSARNMPNATIRKKCAAGSIVMTVAKTNLTVSVLKDLIVLLKRVYQKVRLQARFLPVRLYV
jgi:hypothetical protein